MGGMLNIYYQEMSTLHWFRRKQFQKLVNMKLERDEMSELLCVHSTYGMLCLNSQMEYM